MIMEEARPSCAVPAGRKRLALFHAAEAIVSLKSVGTPGPQCLVKADSHTALRQAMPDEVG
jgi:hypothetical protein